MDNFTKYSLHFFLDINKQTSTILTVIPIHKITTKLKNSKSYITLTINTLHIHNHLFSPLNDLINKHFVTFFITFANEKDASHLRAKAIKKDIYN